MKESNLLPEHGLEETGILCGKQGMNQEDYIWCFQLEWIQMEKGEMDRAGVILMYSKFWYKHL